MPLNTCLFNNSPSTNTSLQKIQHTPSSFNHSFHHLIYSFIGPINDHHSHFEGGHPKLNQILESIMMMKHTQELDVQIRMMIDCLCNLKSSPLSNYLYAKVSNFLENNVQQTTLLHNVQNLYAKKIFHCLITRERLFQALPCSDDEGDELPLMITKKDELSEEKDSDMNEAASTTSGFSRDADTCLWSLTTTDIDRPPHDASGNYLFPFEDDSSLKGALSCYDGFFVGNLEMNFDSADQYLSLPMKQIPGKNTPQKQTPKQIVVEKKTIHQIRTQENMFSSPIVQSKTRFEPTEISNPLTPQYIPQKNQRRSPKSNFHKTYASSTHQSVEKKPVFQQQPQRAGGISMSLFVNDKLKKMDYGHGKKKSHFTDSQPNSGIAKRS